MNSPLWKHPQDKLLLASYAILAIIYCATIHTHDMQRQRRKPHRLYLLRQELLPNPRDGIVWQQLWKSQEDQAFITTMGIDVAIFHYILEGADGFGIQWENSSIPHNDVCIYGEP